MARFATNRALILLACTALIFLSFQSVTHLRRPNADVKTEQGETYLRKTSGQADESSDKNGFDSSNTSDSENAKEKPTKKKLRFDIDSSRDNIIQFPRRAGREVLGEIAEHLGFNTGVEVGVQKGLFAVDILRIWESCQEYVLVDLWAHQDNYIDLANKDQSEQEVIMTEALENVKPWQDISQTCRNYSEVCAQKFPSSHFDYAYIDARHDFKGVFSDLEAWYPKVRTGGIIAGHDYVDSYSVWRISRQNWTVQFDGSLDHGRQSVKGAVNLFFALNKQYITVTDWREKYPSWVVLKTDGERKANEIFHFIDLSCFDGSDCDLVSTALALTVREWEKRNSGFISIVWTTELVKKLFPKESQYFYVSYLPNIAAFEDMMKFVILHKFGGTFIHPSIKPAQSLESIVSQGQELGRPFAFCTIAAPNDSDEPVVDACEKISTLVMGGQKGDDELLKMRHEHQQKISDGQYRGSEDAARLLADTLLEAKLTVFKMKAAFPCDEDAAETNGDCVTISNKQV